MVVRELITKLGFKVDKSQMNKAKNKIQGFKKFITFAVAGAVAGMAAIGLASIKAAGDMEMLTTQFEVMLGSTEKANEMMEKLKTFAAATPFALNDLAKGAQQLLAFGVAENDVIERMRMLGDVSGGSREKLNSMVLAFGKVQTKGKASMEEINMIAERGVPIIGTLVEQLGVTEQQFFKLVSAGKIGRKEITQAFKTMTSEGGIFFKGMEKQSLTFAGLMSTMKDNFSLAAAELGSAMLPVMKEFVGVATNIAQKIREWVTLNKEGLTEGFRKLAEILKVVLKFAFGFIKILFVIAKSPVGAIILGIVVALKTYSIIMGIVTTVQALWNLLLLANPIGLVIAAIGALVAAIIWMIANWDKVTKFFKKSWNAIVGFFKKAIGKIIDFFKNFKTNVKRIWTKIKEAILFAFLHPIKALKKAWNKMKEFFQGIIDGIVDGFKEIFGLGKDADVKVKISEGRFGAGVKQEVRDAATAAIINQNNNININAPQGTSGETGMTPSAVGKVADRVFKRNFNVELKKIMQGAIG